MDPDSWILPLFPLGREYFEIDWEISDKICQPPENFDDLFEMLMNYNFFPAIFNGLKYLHKKRPTLSVFFHCGGNENR